MKGYFAKLAARTALAHVPPPSATYAPKVPDPFEAAEPAPPISSAPEIPKTDRASNISQDLPLAPPAPSARAVLEEKRDVPAAPFFVAAVAPRVPAVTQPAEQPVQGEPGSQLTPSQPTLPGEWPRLEVEGARERLADLERTQAVILQRADAFMGRVLSSKTESSVRPDVETAPQPPNVLKTDARHEPPGRMQPIPSGRPSARDDSDRPSLVIGKLTVEVVPPTLPRAAPQQRITVVRGGRSQTAGLTSVRRFGLGQF